jgi:hypothetical protein
MRSDAEILRRINEVFSACPRPEHFTNYTHCEECLDHDEVLRSRDLETLGMADVGSGGWDPICYISAEGYAYYFPAFARLVLDSPDPHWGWYGPQFIRHLIYDPNSIVDVESNGRFSHFTVDQRMAVAEILEHLMETRAELVDACMCADNLLYAHEIWSETEATG